MPTVSSSALAALAAFAPPPLPNSPPNAPPPVPPPPAPKPPPDPFHYTTPPIVSPPLSVALAGPLFGWGIERYQAIRREGFPDRADMIATAAPFEVIAAAWAAWLYLL